jgi:ABC-2 type transport system ATP-binding protein
MTDFAVDVRAVSKRFRLAHGQYNSLKERIIHGGRRKSTEDFWALDGVSLTVGEGETVGILGRNGSGKSTLLKCICGVLQPTSGEVAVRGKLAGLLELGAGFQQDLTGRENIYLNGSLLGMSRREVDRVFDAIVDFSELEEFIDGPVKFYSSGMYVRLGFAVAVNVDPDILVVDEVLAVGDERFQRKCIDRVMQFQKEGRTILLVTHSADTVRSICDRGVVLSHGRLVAEGEPGEATRIFRERLMAEGAGMSIAEPAVAAAPATAATLADVPDTERPVRFRSVHRVYSGDNTVPYMRTGDDLTIRVEFEALHDVADVVFSLEVRDDTGGTVMRTDTSIIGIVIDAPRGTSVMHFGIVDMPLLDGSFTFALGIQSRGGILYDWQEEAGRFEVMNPGRATGSVHIGEHPPAGRRRSGRRRPVDLMPDTPGPGVEP